MPNAITDVEFDLDDFRLMLPAPLIQHHKACDAPATSSSARPAKLFTAILRVSFGPPPGKHRKHAMLRGTVSSRADFATTRNCYALSGQWLRDALLRQEEHPET